MKTICCTIYSYISRIFLIDSGLNASRGSAGRSPGRAGREAGRPPLQEEEEEEEAEKKHDQLDHGAEVDWQPPNSYLMRLLSLTQILH